MRLMALMPLQEVAPAPAPVYIETTVRAPAPAPGQPPSTGANVSLQLSGITAAQFAQKEQQYNHLVAQVCAHSGTSPSILGPLHILERCLLLVETGISAGCVLVVLKLVGLQGGSVYDKQRLPG